MLEALFYINDSSKFANYNIITYSYYDFCKNCKQYNFDEKYINDLINKNKILKNAKHKEEILKNFEKDVSLVWRMKSEEILQKNIYKKIQIDLEKNQINLESFKEINKNAIISSYEANLKNFPTNEIVFEYDQSKYKNNKFLKKFDLNQLSKLKNNQPIKVLKLTNDKNWALIFTSEDTIGFTQISNLKYISENDEKIFLKHDYDSKIMNFDEQSIKDFLKNHTGKSYSWGDQDHSGFDCSSIVKEYFENFGFHLKRDSSSQINDLNRFEQIKIPTNLNSKEKKQFIIQNAIPFKSILYMKGHVMLFLGEDPNQIGEIIVFHAISSINAIKKNGIEPNNLYKFFISRSIIGKLPDEEFFEKNQSFEPSSGLLIDKIEMIGNLKK
jgi:hypothetical protein